MANTYTQIYIHIVFAVEGRQNLIAPQHNGETSAKVRASSGTGFQPVQFPCKTSPDTTGKMPAPSLLQTSPLGLKTFSRPTQGSSCLATLGWRTQPRWDCRHADFVVSRASHSYKPLEIEMFGNCGEFDGIRNSAGESASVSNPVEFNGIEKFSSVHLESEGFAGLEGKLT